MATGLRGRDQTDRASPGSTTSDQHDRAGRHAVDPLRVDIGLTILLPVTVDDDG